MTDADYIVFKNLTEDEQRTAADKMTLKELRELGQKAVPDLADFLKESYK